MTHASTHILLFHGFTGSPEDMRPLAKSLSNQGFTTQVVTLPGHDSSVAELNATTWQEWVKKSEEVLSKVKSDEPVIVVALSMGALLATLMAAKYPERIKALVLLAPAFALQTAGRIGITLARLGLHHLKPFLPKTKGPNIRDPKAREANKAYREIPVRALVQFDELRQAAILAIKDVSCPVFVGFGAHDGTVDNTASAARLKALKSKRVEWHTYSNSAHIVSVDYDCEQLYSDITRFIESL